MSDAPFTAASFDNFCAEKKLMAAKCKKCGNVMLPPRALCNKCHGDDLEWVELSGKGKLVSFTAIGVGPRPMVDEGWGRDNPYCSGIVEVAEGPRICTQLIGLDAKNPKNIKLGTSMTADFVERGTYSLVPVMAQIRKNYLAFKAAE